MNLGLVITEKHTKLRGFACPQAKREERREERERGRGNSNGVVERGSQTRIYKVRGRVFSKKKRDLKGDLRRYGKKLRKG